MKTNANPQPDRAPDHKRYWLNAKRQPICADCTPPPAGVAVIEVSSTFDDKKYEQEERKGIREG